MLKELKHEVAKQLSAAHTPKRQRMSQTATSGKHICKRLESKAQGQWAVCIPVSGLLAEILTKHKFVTDYNMKFNQQKFFGEKPNRIKIYECVSRRQCVKKAT